MKRNALALILIMAISIVAGALIQNGQKTSIVQAETSNNNTIIKGNANAKLTILILHHTSGTLLENRFESLIY